MSIGFDYGTVAKNITAVREAPLLWFPGVDDNITIQVDGTGTLASPTMVLYENGTDVSATKLTGSLSVSGRAITTKTFASLVGGSVYRYYVYFTDDDIPQVREGTIMCLKLGVNPSKYPGLINRHRIAESPLLIYPSQSVTHVVIVDGEGTLASPTMSIYKGTSDVSASVLSGSMSVDLRRITLKTIASLTGGSEYIFYIFFTDAGKSTVRYGEIITPKLGA